MKKMIAGIIAIGVLFSGCINSLEKTINKSNQNLKKENYPYRYTKYKETETSTHYRLEPIGEKIISVTKGHDLEKDVLRAIKQYCNFSKNDLLETRLVYKKNPIVNEIWVFKDNLSQREDKTSAISVTLKLIPNQPTEIGLNGNCHAIQKNIIFVK